MRMDTRRQRLRLIGAAIALFVLVKLWYSRSYTPTAYEHWTESRVAPAPAPAPAPAAQQPPAPAPAREPIPPKQAAEPPRWSEHKVTEGLWRRPASSVISLRTDAWPAPREGYVQGARYLTYLAHSGYHNQRIALTNALTLAHMLGRTLLVPPATLGVAVDWAPSPKLQPNIEVAENSIPSKCKLIKDRLERRAACGIYWASRRMDWSWMLSDEAISSLNPVITRPSHRRDFFSTALGLREDEIHTFPDRKRLSAAIFDSASAPEPEDFKYAGRINLEDLEAMRDVPLLEFGSLFGSTRLELVKQENIDFREKVRDSMAFDQPILSDTRDELATRLGGEGEYLGLHLRVGVSASDTFKIGVKERTEGIFHELLRKAYGMSEELVTELLETRQKSPLRPGFVPAPLPSPRPGQAHQLSPSLACPRALYPPESAFAKLNRPLYIATDSKSPRDDPLLELFENTLPCWFVWQDFADVRPGVSAKPVEQLDWMVALKDEQGEKIGGMLIPFVEAMVVASADYVVGTPQSTFSNFVKTTLHWAYRGGKPDELDEKA